MDMHIKKIIKSKNYDSTEAQTFVNKILFLKMRQLRSAKKINYPRIAEDLGNTRFYWWGMFELKAFCKWDYQSLMGMIWYLYNKKNYRVGVDATKDLDLTPKK